MTPILTPIWKKILYVVVIFFALIGVIFVGAYFAITFHLTNTTGVVDENNRYLTASVKTAWQDDDEWKTLEVAIVSDKNVIDKVSAQTNIPSRIIVAQVVVEQLRLFHTEREIYKQIFQPLQILGVQSQFSWGVMGLKQETAIAIEQHLTDTTSPYYLGQAYEHTLDFTTPDHNTERFNRLTDPHNHYYSYLYAALFLKQIETQWQKAGFNISNRPEILSTLFNIGFAHSTPNADPKVGGAEIKIADTSYSFGELAYAFYQSDKLLTEFPR